MPHPVDPRFDRLDPPTPCITETLIERSDRLTEAIRTSKLPVIERLLAQGADPNVHNSTGGMPLAMLNDRAGQADAVLERLLQAKVQMDIAGRNGNAALHTMLLNDSPVAMVGKLLDAGANPMAMGVMTQGMAVTAMLPLEMTVVLGNPEVFDRLLTHPRCLPDASCSLTGCTALHRATEGFPTPFLNDVVERLMALGADPWRPNRQGQTPLALAEVSARTAMAVGNGLTSITPSAVVLDTLRRAMVDRERQVLHQVASGASSASTSDGERLRSRL